MTLTIYLLVIPQAKIFIARGFVLIPFLDSPRYIPLNIARAKRKDGPLVEPATG